jgi:tetratricopeptide (TPR) repeat protein
MMTTTFRGLVAAVGLMFPIALGAQDHDHASAQDHAHATSVEKLGSVNFATSCSAPAQLQFNRAVALLHSFEFQLAIDGFGATLKADPSCAIAEWGIALSRWSNPFAAGIRPAGPLQQGRAAVEHARAIGPKTARERAYVDAVSRLYADFETAGQTDRVRAYREAMSKLAAAYPNDSEASIFYALSLAAAASPADKTFADQLKAGAILERLVVRQPDHPGLAHYIIHAYDAPPLANRALEAARRYAKIAPSAAHALHMPSHTFTRLGYWQDSIETNIASSEVAKRVGSTAEELHAMDYRTYAYLQTAQDRDAKQMLDALPEVASRFNPDAIGGAAPGSAGIFALAAIPARYALERGAWAEAAKLEPHPSKFPYTEALTYFARAIGGARIGDTATVRMSIDALQKIHVQLAQAGESYWAEQTEIQRRAASAWLAFAEHRNADALAEMRAVAMLEDNTDKSAVTPGPLAPARELLGEMLLELKEPAQARSEFEATLKKEPNRFRAAYGAARAASLMGDRAAARRYYGQLLKICERGDKPGRIEVVEARQAFR